MTTIDDDVIKIICCVNKVKMSQKRNKISGAENHKYKAQLEEKKKQESASLKFLIKLEDEPKHRRCQKVILLRAPKCLDSSLLASNLLWLQQP